MSVYELNAEEGHRSGGGFPYLVIRLMAAVYQRENVAVEQGRARAVIKNRGSHLSHPGIADNGRAISDAAKSYFEGALVQQVQRTKHRMCIVWSANQCTFVEPNGDIRRTTEPPSGGIGIL